MDRHVCCQEEQGEELSAWSVAHFTGMAAESSDKDHARALKESEGDSLFRSCQEHLKKGDVASAKAGALRAHPEPCEDSGCKGAAEQASSTSLHS